MTAEALTSRLSCRRLIVARSSLRHGMACRLDMDNIEKQIPSRAVIADVKRHFS